MPFAPSKPLMAIERRIALGPTLLEPVERRSADLKERCRGKPDELLNERGG
jgi:hypothetical protein